MSEVASFGNIVNALLSVRNDYNDHLKSVPQYEAFLLVESSTQKVVETLHGVATSSSPSMADEVIQSLEIAKTKFREHLASVPEYRALLAIDKLINEVSSDLGVQTSAPDNQATVAEPEAVSEPAIAAAPETAAADPAALPLTEVASEQDAAQPVAVSQPEVAELEPTPSLASEAIAVENAASDAETAPQPDLVEHAAAPPETNAQAEIAEQTPSNEQAPPEATEEPHPPIRPSVEFGGEAEKAA
jgi:hypothetical protein